MENKDFRTNTVSTASFSDTTDSSYSVLRLFLSSTVFDNVLRTIAPIEITSFKVFSSHLQGKSKTQIIC